MRLRGWRARAKTFWYAPAIKVYPIDGLVRLGSHDCGLTLQPSDDLIGATVVTVGLGEDASFDVELAARFRGKVIVADPTPRSVAYFHALEARFGQPKLQPYAVHGPQPLEAYDLSALKEGSMVLEESALWCENTTLKFFSPPNPSFVSHSIANIQNNYSTDTPYIMVPAITPEALLAKHSLRAIPLLKLDIEGAEVQVIPYMFRQNIFPRQMLVEYDEMLTPSARSKASTEATHALLTEAGYVPRHGTPAGNFLYIRTT